MPEDKKRDPMPSPDATPEEIGEFWDTHSLADYWEETHEAEFQVNLKPEQNQELSDEKKPGLPATTEDESNAALDVVTEDIAGTDIDTVADTILSLNLPAWMLRNASKAFRQLCSAAVEWPAAIFKGKASERHAITATNTKITEAVTDQIIQQIKVPPEYAQIVLNKHMEKIIGEQLNLDNIFVIAANELKNEEVDSSINQGTSEPNEDQSVDSTNQEGNASEEKTISDVWLNNFETVARPQSTEDMQILFGRILAGEINQPGSYSIRTIKALVELDQDAAVLFKKLCSLCVVLEDPDDGSILDARVVSLGGDAAQNALGKYGLGFDQLNVLNECRLIISDYNSWLSYSVSRENESNLKFLLFHHQGKYWDILPLPEQVKNQEFKLSGVVFSRTGRELFRIVDQEPAEEYTTDLKNFLERQNLQMTEIPVQ